MRALDPLAVELRGVQLVEASAGTGKTYAITTLVVRAVLELELDVSRILVVTFTNAATAELRARVRGRLALAKAGLADEAAVAADPALQALLAVSRARGTATADRQRLDLALGRFDEAAIFTIHGFCQRVLQELAFESGARFDTELLGDARAMLVDVVRDFRAAHLFDAAPALLDRLGAATGTRLTGIAQHFLRHPKLRVLDAPEAGALGDAHEQAARALVQRVGPYAVGALARRKAAANVQFFDDLLQSLAAALRADDGALAAHLRGRYPLALIDEFQDTDPVQFQIFRHLYGDGDAAAGVFLIGDPKQAIYAFRGADVFTYFGAGRLARGKHTLLTNWRSAPRLIDAVNRVFDVRGDAFALEAIGFAPAEKAPPNRDALGGAAPLRILQARRADYPCAKKGPHQLRKPGALSNRFFPAVADAIVALFETTALDARPVAPGDVAVLTRTNRQLHLVQAALRDARVPSVVLGDASVFESEEAVMLERVLRALAEPGSGAAVRAALATRLFGRTAAELDPRRDEEPAWALAMTRFQDWSARWRGGGFTSAFRALLDEEDVPARLLAQVGGERALTNLFHLGELLQRAAGAERRGPLALLEWLRRMRLDGTARGEQASEAAQIRLESDVRALKLTTVHKSKGLEYPVVVCPFLWDTRGGADDTEPLFHDADEVLTLDLGWPARAASKARRRAEELAEATRLAYVALTRAQQLGVVVWGPYWGYEKSALARLWHGLQARDAARPRAEGDIRALSDDQIRADLAALATAADGAIAVAPLVPPPNGKPRRYAPPASAPLVLTAPPPPRRVGQPWRLSSFTALAAGSEALGARAEEGIDRDELASAASAAAAAGLDGFPRGRRPGTLVHKIFESIDFTLRDPAALRATVTGLLRAARMDAAHADGLCRAVDDVLDTPLDRAAPPLRLRDVAAARRLNEMEFAFPVALDVAGQPRARLTAARLAAVLAAHAADEAERAYAERLGRLPFPALAGYLRGFIDCVCEHAGRWYVLDYKSNDLGPRAANYGAAAMAAAMAQHDYPLQALLYAVAVHRHLRRRVAGYDYGRDFGGVYYLFVRGMAPARGPDTGVVSVRPSAALIDAVDALLAGGEA